MVLGGIAVELEPRRPIFEKCSHLREKGGVLTLRTPIGFVLTPDTVLHTHVIEQDCLYREYDTKGPLSES